VWCNGHNLGHHEGGYDPMEFDLTEALVSNESGQLSGTLVVRVEDLMNKPSSLSGSNGPGTAL
jgi:beta-galactosidase/beta-glucuronidase